MEQVAKMEGQVIQGYLGVIFHYLQFSYYKCEYCTSGIYVHVPILQQLLDL